MLLSPAELISDSFILPLAAEKCGETDKKTTKKDIMRQVMESRRHRNLIERIKPSNVHCGPTTNSAVTFSYGNPTVIKIGEFDRKSTARDNI